MIVEIELDGILTVKRVPKDIADDYRKSVCDLLVVREYFAAMGYYVGAIRVM